MIPLWHGSLHCATLSTSPLTLVLDAVQNLALKIIMKRKTCQLDGLWMNRAYELLCDSVFLQEQYSTSESFPVRNTTDGCTTALSSLCTVLMALWASSCHQVTRCKLFNLQSAEPILGVMNQTPRQRKPQNVFLNILLLFAHRSVNSPTLPANHTHRERRGVSDETNTVLAGYCACTEYT